MNDSQKTNNIPETVWDHRDPLWQLLGESPLPQPDGWFTAKTMALIRQEKERGESHARWFVFIRRFAVGGSLAAVLAALVIVSQLRQAEEKHEQTVQAQKNVQEAFAYLASIETSDSDSGSSSSWQDSSM